MMTREEYTQRYVEICENGAEAAEVLARAALPPGAMATVERADRAASLAVQARGYRNEAEKARRLLG